MTRNGQDTSGEPPGASHYVSAPSIPPARIDAYRRRRNARRERPDQKQVAPAFPLADFLPDHPAIGPSYADFLVPKE